MKTPWPPEIGQLVRVPRVRGTIAAMVSHGKVKGLHPPYYIVLLEYGARCRRTMPFKLEQLQPAGSREPRIYLETL